MCIRDRGEAGADQQADLDAIAGYATALTEAVTSALPDWVERSVQLRCHENNLADADPQQVTEAGRAAAEDIGCRLEQQLTLDIDDQWTTPLTIIRSAIKYPTEILSALGCPPTIRDDFAQRANPGDLYDLTPASFADLGPEVHGHGIAWGAAKAHIHLRRRKGEGQ